MGQGSYPLAFGELLVGAVLIGRGAPAIGDAIKTGAGGTASGSGLSSGLTSTRATAALNSRQQTFASTLAADTGLDPNVVAAWVHAEEPASASSAPNGANNWLNIGAFDSGNFAGSGAAEWSDPVAAAHLTAHWLSGASIPGLGTASAGIRSILSSARADPGSQVRAIQQSGWATSGYPDLPGIYQSFAG